MQYLSAQLLLPPLRPIDIEEIMTDVGLLELYKGKYREFWNAIGMIPRHLEWALGNAAQELKSMTVNDETVQTTIYANVVKTIKSQYFKNFDDQYFGELALRTISRLKIEKDEKPNVYVREGKVYYTDGLAHCFCLIGVPLVVIDVLATKMNFIPKLVVSDFITESNKPLGERFEELCLKTMTARFNVLFTLNHSQEVRFIELFKWAHCRCDLGFIPLRTSNSSWFKYDCLNDHLSNDEEKTKKLFIPLACKS